MFETRQKYIRLVRFNEFIIFDSIINHSQFSDLEIKSAGFCEVYNNKVTCFGESVTLKLKSDKEDSFLATKQFFGIEQAEKSCT